MNDLTKSVFYHRKQADQSGDDFTVEEVDKILETFESEKLIKPIEKMFDERENPIFHLTKPKLHSCKEVGGELKIQPWKIYRNFPSDRMQPETKKNEMLMRTVLQE